MAGFHPEQRRRCSTHRCRACIYSRCHAVLQGVPGDAGGRRARDDLRGRPGSHLQLARQPAVGGRAAVGRRRGVGGRGGLRLARRRRTRRQRPAVGVAVLRQGLRCRPHGALPTSTLAGVEGQADLPVTLARY